MAFTYFFRDRETLEMIREIALPSLRTRMHINIWDAGCAHGPEPFSIAILLRENMGQFLFRNVHIYATDIDESNQFGETIRQGVYPEEQVQRIPQPIFERYFQPSGNPGHFRVVEEIRQTVSFERHDLLTLKPIREGFGMVVCKNVLLHFKEAERNGVVKMFHHALDRGGIFVTEQTQKLPAEVGELFELIVSNTQIFRKVDDK
jgi:chemotaxis protein methyltransferase CheR